MSDCPVCEGKKYIRYGNVITLLPSRKNYVAWEIGQEIPCGCVQLVPIRGEAS